MNIYADNKTTIVIAVVAVVLLGGAWYLFSNSMGGNEVGNTEGTPLATTTPATSTSTVTQAAPKKVVPAPKKVPLTAAKVAGIGSISYLIGLKESLVCSVKTMSGYSRIGTMYVAGGQVRGDFTSSSMIDDGTYLYAWMSNATNGLKLLAASSASGSAIANNGGIDLATNLSFSCNDWKVDPTVFLPPTTVSFSNSL